MGLFTKSNQKLSLKEITRALYDVSGLSSSERKVIIEALRPNQDLGGITKYELKKTLRRLEREGKLEKDDKRRVERKIL